MLQITIPEQELWDESKQEFTTLKEQTLQLEHSLISLSKWESKWHKSFFLKDEKTNEETIDYIKCMTLTKNVSPDIYDRLTMKNIRQIDSYINDPMTATTFRNTPTKGKINGETVTSELVYYWMIALQIPFECQKWNFNRLLTLIRVCELKNQPAKKMSNRDVLSQNAALNAARKKKLNTRG